MTQPIRGPETAVTTGTDDQAQEAAATLTLGNWVTCSVHPLQSDGGAVVTALDDRGTDIQGSDDVDQTRLVRDEKHEEPPAAGLATLGGRVASAPDLEATAGRSGGGWLQRGLLGGAQAPERTFAERLRDRLVVAHHDIFGVAPEWTLLDDTPIAEGLRERLAHSRVWQAITALADHLFAQPHKACLDRAVARLRSEGLTGDERGNLAAFTDGQWSRLLHVPSRKAIDERWRSLRRAPSGIDLGRQRKRAERRQKIQHALVRHVAKTGDLRGAMKLRAELVTAAADRALDRAIAQAQAAYGRGPRQISSGS